MSNYYAYARPKRRDKGSFPHPLLKVEMIDNYFGLHQYGVRFPNGLVYREEDCEIKLTI